MADSSNRPDVYQIVTDRIITLLEQGTAPWHKPWSCADAAPKNLVSGKEYQGINTFLLGCQQYDSPYWLTFRQAQEKGGHVRKGEKGSPCIFWKLYEKEDENAEDGKVVLPVLRYYTVFNARQCEGLDVPEIEIKTWPENEKIDQAEAIQLAMPNRPQVTYGGGRASYNPHTDTVNVPELIRHEKPEEFYSTLFHELAHSTGHESRLNRESVTGRHFFGEKEYGKEELIAEMTAAFLCAHCGIENATIDNSAAYLQGWIKALRGDKKLAITAGAQAQKAVYLGSNRMKTESQPSRLPQNGGKRGRKRICPDGAKAKRYTFMLCPKAHQALLEGSEEAGITVSRLLNQIIEDFFAEL